MFTRFTHVSGATPSFAGYCTQQDVDVVGAPGRFSVQPKPMCEVKAGLLEVSLLTQKDLEAWCRGRLASAS